METIRSNMRRLSKVLQLPASGAENQHEQVVLQLRGLRGCIRSNRRAGHDLACLRRAASRISEETARVDAVSSPVSHVHHMSKRQNPQPFN